MSLVHLLWSSLLLVCTFPALAAQVAEPTSAAKSAQKSAPEYVLHVAVDRADALYKTGEPVVFSVAVTHRGAPATIAEAEWSLTKDGVSLSQSGRLRLDQGRGSVLGRLEEPGFLQCRITVEVDGQKLSALAGAGASPTEILPSAPAPDDFDEFWRAKKEALALIPAKSLLTPANSASEGIEVFDLSVDSLGAPVSGYYARPKSALPRSLPAVLTVHGAGVRSAAISTAVGWAKDDALGLDINAHGLPNGRASAFYDALATGELKGYRHAGLHSRDSVYFLGMFLRLVRAIDFLTSQPEWDGRTLIVYGSSQGGAQAIAAAGLDPRVTFFVAGVPAMADHTGALIGRIAGWPKFIATGSKPTPEVVSVIKYFDVVNFAARTKAAGFFTVGFIDTTCPPTSIYAAYNALTAPKAIFNDITSGHTNTPAASAAMRTAALRHLAAQRRMDPTSAK